MNLLLPAFLGATVLVGLPLLLHLLRRQPRRLVPFPSLRFLGHDALRDSNRQRLRRWLTLLLRCLLILLIAIAFSRPFWPLEHTDDSRAVIVVVDNSYSMQAEGRREEVLAWLNPQLKELRPPDELGVLLLHPTPTWLAPLTTDLDAGRAVFKSFPTGYETSRYRAGLELAALKLNLTRAKHKQILVAGDQQQLAWSGVRFDHELPAGIKLFTAPVAAAPRRQAAVTALKAARTADGQVALEATLRSFGPGIDERTVTFYSGEQALGTRRCGLTPGRTQTVRAEFAVPDFSAAMLLRASVDGDALPVDDVAYAVLAATHDRRVLLSDAAAGAKVDFLRTALESVRAGALPSFRVDPLPPTAPWPVSSVVVLRGASAFRSAAALDAFVAGGGSAWVLCDGSPEQAAWLTSHGVTISAARPPTGEKLKLRDIALEHPLFAPFNGHSIAPLLAPTFRRGWAIDGAGIEPLARWPDRSVAIAEIATGGGRLLVTGFGETRIDSTFPLEASYVPFVHQAIAWLAQNEVSTADTGRVGTLLALPGAGDWRAVLSPKIAPPEKVADAVTPDAPGIYAFEQEGTRRLFAINVDTAESDLAPWPKSEDFNRLVAAEPSGLDTAQLLTNRDQPVDEQLVDERQAWWWLIIIAVVVLYMELALANRTIP